MKTVLDVLLVEDREDDALMIADALLRAGFEPRWRRVDEKTSFEAALDASTPDVILADWRLPGWSGLAALDLVQSRGLDVPFILVSANIGEEQAVEAMRCGAADYLLKDRLGRLGSSVRQQIESRQLRLQKRAAAEALDRERALAEEALRQSEERYRSIVESATDMVVTFSPDGRFTSLNSAFERTLGWSPGEWIGVHFNGIVDASSMHAALEMWNRMLGGAAVTTGELSVRTRSGEPRLLQIKAVPIVKDGRIVQISAIGRDVSDERRAERQRRELTQRMEAVLESTDEGLLAVDGEGLCTMVNRSAIRMLGYTRDELIGRPLHALIHHTNADGRHYAASDCVMHRALQSGSTVRNANDRFWKRDGAAMDVETAASPILEGTVIRGAVITFTDITRRHALERQLETANRVSSLGRLTATIAHEFNNVLMGIQPFAEVVARRAKDDPQLGAAAENILKSVQRGRRVTQNILQHTQMAEPSLQPVPVEALLEGVATEAKSLLPTIRLTVDDRSGGARLLCDRVQLHQILINLLLNARDARAGAVGISVGVDTNDAAHPYGPVEQASRFIRLTVSDDGAGIAPEILPHIFEPLFTSKHSGTGLGLAVAHQVVTRHGGQIFVESVEGKGTTFHLFIPLAAEERPAICLSSHRKPPAGTRVLLVDDDDAVVAGLAGILEDEGYAVSSVNRGALAVDAVRRLSPDAVVLDVGLPDVNGIDVYRQIAEVWPDLPVIFSTGHADVGSIEELVSKRNVACLRKPYEVEQLLDRLAACSG